MGNEKTILVVDDSPVALEIITDDLTDAGYMVLNATTSEEAMTIIDSGYKPNLILVDVMMPGMNGDEFAKMVKSRPTTRDIPVVFVSTKDEGELKAMIASAGADGYLRKASLSSGKLASLIDKFIKK